MNYILFAGMTTSQLLPSPAPPSKGQGGPLPAPLPINQLASGRPSAIPRRRQVVPSSTLDNANDEPHNVSDVRGSGSIV